MTSITRTAFLWAIALSSASFAATAPGPAPTTITLTPAALQFTYSVTDARLPAAQAVQVKGTKAGLDYAVTVPSSVQWLTATPASGVTPGALSVRVNPSSLQAGTYNAEVTVTSTGASNSPQKFKVSLVVKGVPPVLTASPASIQFNYATGAAGATPAAATLAVASSGQSAAVTVTTSSTWLKLSAGAGFTVAGSPLSIDLSVDPRVVATLVPKIYDGSVAITPNDPSIKAITIPVKLSVTAGLPVLDRIWPAAVPVGAASISLTLTGSNFLNTSIVSIGGTDVPAAGVTLAGNTVLMVAVPSPVLSTPGTYAVAVKNGSLASANADFKVNPPGPYVAGIADAASFFSSGNISPGEIFSVFGSALGPAELAAGTVSGGKLPTRIADTEVQFEIGGAWIPAPLIFAKSNQINSIAPFELAPGTTKVRVTANASATTPDFSTPMLLTVTAANPGIFTVDASGQGQAAVLNTAVDPTDSTRTLYSLNSSKNPALKGSVIVLYVTGAGQMNPAGVNGQIVSGTPPATAVVPSVTVNGTSCPVLYHGAVTGSVLGLVQINATLPADLQAGSVLPLVVSFAGKDSQTGVTVAVK